MITEPTTGWAKNALQDFETLYIGGAEPASFAGPSQAGRGTIRLCDCEGKFTGQDGSYRLGEPV